MTEEEITLELNCYKSYINPDCDLDNMTEKDVRDFFKYYKKTENYINSLPNDMAEKSDDEILDFIRELNSKLK